MAYAQILAKFFRVGIAEWNQWKAEHPDHLFTADLDFSSIKFRGWNLSGIDLSIVDLTHTDLSGVNLSGAKLSSADLRGIPWRLVMEITAHCSDATGILSDQPGDEASENR